MYGPSSSIGWDRYKVRVKVYNPDVCVVDFFLCLAMFESLYHPYLGKQCLALSGIQMLK